MAANCGAGVHRNPFARNGRWTLKTEKTCDFEVSRTTLSYEMDVGRQKLRKIATFIHCANPFARNGRWTSKTEKNCDFEVSRATLSHVGRQKLKNFDFELSIATITHEMDVGRQKRRKNAILLGQSQPLCVEWSVGRQKTEEKCDFTWSIVTLSHEMDVGR